MNILGIEFSSKTQLSKYVREMLASYDPGETLAIKDDEFIRELIWKHPRQEEKIGVGIKNIVVKKDPIYKIHKQFWIIRDDGSEIDFSYRKCCFGDISTIDLFRHACRSAVASVIIIFKIERLKDYPVCPYMNLPLTKENSHVDHKMPATFNKIVDQFIEDYDVNLDAVIIVGEIQKRFKHEWLTREFRKYHDSVAILQLVSAEANQTYCKQEVSQCKCA